MSCRVVVLCLQNQESNGVVTIVSQAPVTKGGVLMWFKDRLIDPTTGRDIVLPTPYSGNTKTLAQCMAPGAVDEDTCSDGAASFFPRGGFGSFLPMYAGFVSDYLAVAQLHGYQMPQYYQSHYNSNGLFTKYDTISVRGYGSTSWVEVLDPQSPICQVCRARRHSPARTCHDMQASACALCVSPSFYQSPAVAVAPWHIHSAVYGVHTLVPV